jgi:dolichyl-diphosphooligosaccharide--protein glycosyltransferase
MYLSPFIGAGVGYLIELGIKRVQKEKKRLTLTAVAAAILGAAILYSNAPSFNYLPRPKIPPALARELYSLKETTPPDGWIWTWWDFGNAIKYYGERATYHDGQSQFSPKTYFIANSFVQKDLKRAWNEIWGVSNLGKKGIERLLKEGVPAEKIKEEITEGKFTKPVGHPVYWLFTEDLIGKFYWISYLGTWDFKKEKGKNLLIKLNYCVQTPQGTLACRGGLTVDPINGVIKTPERAVLLKKLTIRDGNGKLLDFSYGGKLFCVDLIQDPINPKFYVLFLMTYETYETAFNQLFILRRPNPYFELVHDRFPLSVLYRVKTPKKSKG